MNKRFSLLDSLLHLVFPNQCIVCDKELGKSEQKLCSFCQGNLTYTHYHLYKEDSPMDKLFWGRVVINKTYAHLLFEKNKASQKILFNIKYKNSPQLARFFGEKIGTVLNNAPAFDNIELLIPVPLHPKKAFIRGYNQSEELAKGIGEKMNIPMNSGIIKKAVHTETQTRKSRFKRWDNVQGSFIIKNEILDYQHIAIIDDVITTGSTIESIAQEILKKNPNLSISVITLAIA